VGRSLCVDLVLSPRLYRATFLLGKVAVAFLRTGTQKVLSFHSCGSATGIQQFMRGSPFLCLNSFTPCRTWCLRAASANVQNQARSLPES